MGLRPSVSCLELGSPLRSRKNPTAHGGGCSSTLVPLLVRFFGLAGLGGWKLQITIPQQVVGELGSGAFPHPQGVETLHFRNRKHNYSQILAFFGLGLFDGTSESSVWCVGCDVSPGLEEKPQTLAKIRARSPVLTCALPGSHSVF